MPSLNASPIEAALATPGFRIFWTNLIESLQSMHAKLLNEAEKAAKVGNVTLAHSFILRAAQVTEIIDKITPAPKQAVEREKEKLHGRPDESRRAGYSDSI